MMRKKYTLFGVLALVFALFPSVAFALDIWPNGSYWAGVPYNEPGYHAAFVRADNRYDAAVYGLGLDPASLSAETKLKLSDPNYGGNFYKYAMTFENVSGWDDMPEWLPTYVMMGTIGLGQSFERIYASKTTSALRTSALADYETVVSGGNVGGGGSGGNVNVSQCYELTCADMTFTGSSGSSDKYFYARAASIDSDGNVIPGSGVIGYSVYTGNSYYVDSARVYVPASMYNYLVREWSGNHCMFAVHIPSFKIYTARVGFYVSSDDITVSRQLLFSNTYTDVLNFSGTTYRYLQYDVNAYYDSEGVFYVLSDADVSLSSFSDNYTNPGFYSQSFVIPSYVAPPAGEWPEPTAPVTPDPPEVPTPTAPTETVDPNPTAPTITWPTLPTLVLPSAPVVDTTPEGIDYTALLTLINDNLNSIDAYLQNFYTSFNSFRSDFLSGIDDIVDGLRNIYQYLGHLNNILEVHCKHITDQIEESVYNLELYVKRLFEWLPKQLDFDAEYDDSAVTTLLYRILNKIPGSSGSPITYKPNPQSDEPGFFDFLADLWHRFLLDLVSVLPDALGGLVDDISQLTHYFPFSIPWDMFALLALFAHEPVTPVFDVPWGYGGDEGEIQMIRVDLSAWDGVMETVRPVFLVGFCMQLAMITKDLLANFDLKQGGV